MAALYRERGVEQHRRQPGFLTNIPPCIAIMTCVLAALLAAVGGAVSCTTKSTHEAFGIPTPKANAEGLRMTRMAIYLARHIRLGGLQDKHEFGYRGTVARASCRQTGGDDQAGAGLDVNKLRYLAERLTEDSVKRCIKICGARSLNKPSRLEKIYRDLSNYVLHDNADHVLATVGRGLSQLPVDNAFFNLKA